MIPVPRLWPGATVVILANGPSLTAGDVALCRGRHLVAVKNAVLMAPETEVLYGCDAKWWRAHPETEAFAGLKYGLERPRGRNDVCVLQNTGEGGLELDPSGLRTFKNSGGQAINLAVHLGASKIVLLGFDMQPTNGKHHWFGWHAYGHEQIPAYALFLSCMATMVEPLRQIGVTVINASRQTAMTCFPRLSLEEALA